MRVILWRMQHCYASDIVVQCVLPTCDYMLSNFMSVDPSVRRAWIKEVAHVIRSNLGQSWVTITNLARISSNPQYFRTLVQIYTVACELIEVSDDLLNETSWLHLDQSIDQLHMDRLIDQFTWTNCSSSPHTRALHD
jgi:hypothetical protein